MENINFGVLIRERRNKMRLSQEQLANRLGVSKNTVYNWEKGGKPEVDALIKLAQELDIVSELFPGYRKVDIDPVQSSDGPQSESAENRTTRKLEAIEQRLSALEERFGGDVIQQNNNHTAIGKVVGKE